MGKFKMENKTKYRLDLYFNLEKEQNWMNRMCEQGWALERMRFFGMLCQFRSCTPGEYQYCVQLTEHRKSTPQGKAYEEFLEEMEIDCLFNLAGFAVLRRKNTGEPFTLYTDHTGKLLHLKRKRAVFLTISIAFFLSFLLFLFGWIMGLQWNPFSILQIIRSICLVIYLLGTIYGVKNWLFYRKQIQLLEKNAEENTEVLPQEHKHKSGYSPFLGWFLGTIAIAAAAGALGGFIWGLCS